MKHVLGHRELADAESYLLEKVKQSKTNAVPLLTNSTPSTLLSALVCDYKALLQWVNPGAATSSN